MIFQFRLLPRIAIRSNFMKMSQINEVTAEEPDCKKPKTELQVDATAAVEAEQGSSTSDVKQVHKIKRRRLCMKLSFCGLNYFGMQINLETPTIERELLHAMKRLDWITDDMCEKPGMFYFQRAARTDRAVSAISQLCSMELPLEVVGSDNAKYVTMLNEQLPTDIRVHEIQRTTAKFDAKKWCSGRTYQYTLPTYAFTPVDEVIHRSYRLPDSQFEEVNRVMKIFCGTHNFFNFTSQRPAEDASCQRHIVSFVCEAPFVVEGVEFANLLVTGQSFMQHQIRKMVALLIGIVRGLTEVSTIQRAWESTRLDIPKAPGLGLMLKEVHYEWYNKKFVKTHEPINFDAVKNDIDQFEKDHIRPIIIRGERKSLDDAKNLKMWDWLPILFLHQFAERKEDSAIATRLKELRDQQKVDNAKAEEETRDVEDKAVIDDSDTV